MRFSRLALFTSFALLAVGPARAERLTLNFNPDWRFVKADPAEASAPGFDDAAWSVVSTPHTFNDTDTFDNWSTPNHRGEQIQWSGRTWYRKTFTAPAAWTGKKVFIEFEAARQIAEVYLNGKLLGVSKTGFTPFGFDLTPHLVVGKPNVLAVMVDNRFMLDPSDSRSMGVAVPAGQPRGPTLGQIQARMNEAIPARMEDLRGDQIPWNNPHWHPAHGGLYRNVRLHVTDPLHIELPLFSFLQTAGPYAYATEISSQSAQVAIEVPVRNGRSGSADVTLDVKVIDAGGKTVLALSRAQPVAAGAGATFQVSGKLAKPRLWEPAYPHVYRVVCALRVGKETVDTTEVPLGIRSVRWDVAKGFFINGQHVKLRGWGQKSTNEWPGLGAALPDWLQFLTMKLMREANGNFVRWGHVPGGPAQIAAADQLGIVTLQPGVDGEHDTVGAAWALRVEAFRDVVIYFRNNPSILIWEGGNQKVTREHAAELRGLMDRYDPHGGRAYAHRRADGITAAFMDVGIGTEGGREIAGLPVVEGEYNREESPRRVWDEFSPPNFGYPEAKGMTYQLTSEQFALNQVSHYLTKLGSPEHSGGANWIFTDSTSGGRVPSEVARASGEVDAVRLPKEAYFVCATMWAEEPRVHILGHWSYPSNTKKNVHVVSNAERVELFVNGRSLGAQQAAQLPADPARFIFTFAGVAFELGEIKAVAFRGGKSVATQSKRTAGAPVALRVTPIVSSDGLRADGADIALFDVEAVDEKGERCPTFQQRVDFTVDGPGVWRGGYNSGKIDTINHPYLDLEAGINRVAVRATRTAGTIAVRATAPDLRAGEASVDSRAFAVNDGAAAIAPAWPKARLPKVAPVRAFEVSSTVSKPVGERGKELPMVGRFTKTFNYSGPTGTIVHVETGARDGKRIYVDVPAAFAALPAPLVGADWVQTANLESRFHAVDLMQLSIVAGSTVFIAHDDGLPRPPWLTDKFRSTEHRLEIAGRKMTVFQYRAAAEEALTLGANSEMSPTSTPESDAAMYIVFVQGAAPAP